MRTKTKTNNKSQKVRVKEIGKYRKMKVATSLSTRR